MAEDKNCSGSPATIPSRSCRSKSSYFFTQPLPGPGRNRLCSGLSPVVFTFSQEQGSGASSGCGVLQRTATAAAGGGCPGGVPAAATAGAKASLVSRHAPCEQPTMVKALAQRVAAFIFSWCAVLTEGRDEKGETASFGQSAAETSFADTGGRGNPRACLRRPAPSFLWIVGCSPPHTLQPCQWKRRTCILPPRHNLSLCYISPHFPVSLASYKSPVLLGPVSLKSFRILISGYPPKIQKSTGVLVLSIK